MRVEKDALGQMSIPDEMYYGIQTVRCMQNHHVTDHSFNELPEVIQALAEIKKACAITNESIGALETHKAKAIIQACDEIIVENFVINFLSIFGALMVRVPI